MAYDKDGKHVELAPDMEALWQRIKDKDPFREIPFEEGTVIPHKGEGNEGRWDEDKE